MRLLVCAAVLMSAMSAQADEGATAKENSCQAQSDIVAKAVEMRRSGKREGRVKRTLAKDASIAEEFQPAVPLLVGWVYTLPKADLKLEPGAAYLTTCLEQ
ncbi:hypothetical protein NBRC116601_04400 [Cognatishimia sp. WU-CL00825]|uniref:hypothetical protein n=1 Tax=Cognatishimia sp. WU-CL00825 TaxID=3127658 RepID=UPI00310A5FFD